MMLQLQAYNERTFTVTLKNLVAGARTIYCAIYPTTDQSVSLHSSHCTRSHRVLTASITYYRIIRASCIATLSDSLLERPQ